MVRKEGREVIEEGGRFGVRGKEEEGGREGEREVVEEAGRS